MTEAPAWVLTLTTGETITGHRKGGFRGIPTEQMASLVAYDGDRALTITLGNGRRPLVRYAVSRRISLSGNDLGSSAITGAGWYLEADGPEHAVMAWLMPDGSTHIDTDGQAP